VGDAAERDRADKQSEHKSHSVVSSSERTHAYAPTFSTMSQRPAINAMYSNRKPMT